MSHEPCRHDYRNTGSVIPSARGISSCRHVQSLPSSFWHGGCIVLIPTMPATRSRSESARHAVGDTMMTESPSPEPAAPLGATIQADGVHFAVWAPAANTVEVEVHGVGGLTHHPLV